MTSAAPLPSNSHLGRSCQAEIVDRYNTRSHIMIKEILVVPDPGRKKTQLQLQRQTCIDWVLASLPQQEADYLLGNKDLDGLIYAATAQQLHDQELPEGHKMVYINEVVLLMWHTIDVSPNNCLRACYMNFKTFTEIIHMRLDRLQLAMRNFAAVWGGLDLTKNYREAPVLFRPTGSSSDREDATLCCTFEKYVWGLRRLEGVLPVWPGTLECRAASHDYNAITLLDSIARDVTQSHRITTELITPETKLHPKMTNHVVIKRESSASRQFIKYPGKQKMLDEAKECGEYRLFMQPLRKSNPDQCNFMVREGGTRAEISQAQAEIQEFLVTTLAVFIRGEETMLGRQGLENRLQPSSLRVSARVDLSVITDPESKKLHYFVTGISRGPGMMLYGSVDTHTIRRHMYLSPDILFHSSRDKAIEGSDLDGIRQSAPCTSEDRITGYIPLYDDQITHCLEVSLHSEKAMNDRALASLLEKKFSGHPTYCFI
ncbi:hypothetical protein BD769DRAFT_1388641 [Suillus cothurnatus]|nr:hypothetical protein BD769DRAFT_1388641 [Suillus cothurnatus]